MPRFILISQAYCIFVLRNPELSGIIPISLLQVRGIKYYKYTSTSVVLMGFTLGIILIKNGQLFAVYYYYQQSPIRMTQCTIMGNNGALWTKGVIHE